MKPVLFEIGPFTAHSYGFMIVVGAFLGYQYLAYAAHKNFKINRDLIGNLIFIIALSAFVGGKLLFYLEDPGYYFSDPSRMISDLGGGFVFFGSLLFAVPATIWYFKKQRWPIIPLLDHLAITALIVHAFGRIGCFMAGCCHGTVTDSIVGVTYTDPMSQAEPLHVPLHPTQLYEFAMLSVLALFLIWFTKRKAFHGQVFLLYLMLYSVGRSIIEEFRGDEARGFLFDGWLSHSQFISLLIIAISLFFYFRWKGKSDQKA